MRPEGGEAVTTAAQEEGGVVRQRNDRDDANEKRHAQPDNAIGQILAKPLAASEGRTNSPDSRNINGMKKPFVQVTTTLNPDHCTASTTGAAAIRIGTGRHRLAARHVAKRDMLQDDQRDHEDAQMIEGRETACLVARCVPAALG